MVCLVCEGTKLCPFCEGQGELPGALPWPPVVCQHRELPHQRCPRKPGRCLTKGMSA